ncbi:MAG: PAS domain-containing protein, partial [Nitrospiraceae bacterium]
MLALLPVMAFGSWALWSLSSALDEASRTQAQWVADDAMAALDKLLLERRGDLLLVAGLPAMKGLDPVSIAPALDHLVAAKSTAYRLALVADAQGRILAVNQFNGEGRPIPSAQLLGQTVAQEGWFQDALRAVKPVMVAWVQADPLTQTVFGANQPVLTMSVPIKDELGTVAGVLSARLMSKPLPEVLSSRSQLDTSGGGLALALLSKAGSPLADPMPLTQEGRQAIVMVPASGFLASSGLGWRVAVYGTEGEGRLDAGTVLAGLTGALLLTGFGVTRGSRCEGLAQENQTGRRDEGGQAESQPQPHATAEASGSSTADLAPLSQELQLIFDSVPVMIWCKDTENRILRVNKLAAASIGRPVSDIEGRFVKELFPDEADQYYQEDLAVIRSGLAKTGMIEPYHAASGEKRWLRTDKIPRRDERGNIIGVLALSVDITDLARAEEAERKRAGRELDQSEEQIRQLQRMEAVGRLAGDVAHDFSNLLTIILGHSQLLREGLDRQAPLFQPVDEITKAAERATSLLQHLLVFSRKQSRQLQRLNLNEIVAAQAPMLQQLCGDRIRVVQALAPELGWVLADVSQVEQVLLHLCLNAREAMPNGGTVTVETRNVTLEPSFVQRYMRSKPGAYVMLAVADTGVGMDDYVQARCFEPFFTTKPNSDETGLGLSTVYGIVKQSDGAIEIVSAPGQGATFKIYFPCVEAGPGGVANRGAARDPEK